MNQLQTFYQTIRDRMRNLELDVSNLTPQSIGFLFNTLQHLQTRLQLRQYYQSMNNLLNSNISIDNDDLLWLLGLRQVNLEEEVLDNDIVYYIRSWTVQAPILQQLIIEMGPEALEFEEVESWLDYATQNPNQPLYIRYVGRCTGPTTPVDRHLEDIARAGGVLGYFLQALRQVDVISFAQATLFELNAAHYQAGTATARDIDLRDQIIINFLGLDNLMNQQPGGSHASYMPRRPIFIRHQQLYPTTFFQDFFTHSNLTDNEPWIIESMGHWVRELSMQARYNGEATDTINNPMSHEYIESIANQATPQRLVNDRVVSIIIGKDITLNGFNNPSGFLTNDPGYAPTLTREILFRHCAWSQNRTQWNNNDETLVQESFPFIDMYPWLGTSNSTAPALNQLRLYLHLWSPIVISTMSYEVSSAAFANFFHTHGTITTESYIRYVGVPRIVHYPTLEWLYNRDEDTLPNEQSTIAIPHIHPGFPKYDARSQQLLRIIDLTWAITTIINEITVRVLQGNNTDSTETIVMLVWNQCNPQSTALDARLQQLYNDLNASKNDYQQYRQQRLLRQRPAVRNINTQALELASAQRIELGGEAEGQPFSEVREVQVNALWKRNLPDLHLHISRNNKEQWLQWARSINQGIYFYTSSLRRSAFVMRERHPLYNVLARFPPEDVHDDTWMEDPELVRRSLTRWSRHSMTFLPQNHFAPQAQRRRRLAALEQARPRTFDATVYEYRNSLENQRVYVPRTNPIVFYWNDGNENIRVKIRPQRGIFAPEAPETARFYHVHFLVDGIGFTALTGIPIRVNGNVAVISLNQMGSSPHSHNLMRLWRHERRLLGHNVPEPVVAAPEGHQPRPAFRSNTSSRFIREFSQHHLHPNDSLSLLRLFLDDLFPQGGSINMAPEDLEPFVATGRNPDSSVSVRPQLLAFLHNHQHHPYHGEWLEFANNMRQNGQHFFKNINYLRHNTERSIIRKYPPPQYQYRQCQRIDFKLPRQRV